MIPSEDRTPFGWLRALLGTIPRKKRGDACDAYGLRVEIKAELLVGRFFGDVHSRSEGTAAARHHEKCSLALEAFYESVRIEILVIVFDYPPIHFHLQTLFTWVSTLAPNAERLRSVHASFSIQPCSALGQWSS